MKFGLRWLADFLTHIPETARLHEQLPLKGFEIAYLGEHGADLGLAHLGDRLVIAEILLAKPHPDADKLQVCQVADGQTTHQIVCGAPNARAGIQVVLALPGAVLPGDFAIKESTIRGVVSQGMLCSARELGLGDDHQGILECTGTNGEAFYRASGFDEQVLEVEITPNRGDCLSVLGMAREISAIFAIPFKPSPHIDAVSPNAKTSDVMDDNFADQQAGSKHRDSLSVKQIFLDAPQACPTYHALALRFSKPLGNSPQWIVRRLEMAGLHAIHPFVDVTNIVMLELGQPLHAFDSTKIHGDIHVRFAEFGESVQLLNDHVVELQQHHLLIADEKKPIALAGVMGSSDSAVDNQTTEILVEAAHFRPDAVAGRARELRLTSDACFRFERGVDPTLPTRALERANELLLAIATWQQIRVTTVAMISQTSDQYMPVQPKIEVDFVRIQNLAGITFDVDKAKDILIRLGMMVDDVPFDNANNRQSTWIVTPPTWRFDMFLMQDVLEELLRLHGMYALPDVMPRLDARRHFPEQNRVMQSVVEDYFVALGYQETISYSFISRQESDRFLMPRSPFVIESTQALPKEAQAVDFDDQSVMCCPVELANAISDDLAVMRSMVCISLLRVLEYNYRYQFRNLQVFETGLQFHKIQQVGEIICQIPVIAMACIGNRSPVHWRNTSYGSDFFSLKGDIESLCARFGYLQQIRFETLSNHPGFHPGRSAKIYKGDQFLGIIGELHPQMLQVYNFGTDRPVVAELQLDVLLRKDNPRFVSPSNLPGVVRDLSFVIKRDISFASIESLIKQQAGPYIKSVIPFDIFRDDSMLEDTHSLAVRLSWNNSKATMTERQINYFCQRVIRALEKEYQAQLRS